MGMTWQQLNPRMLDPLNPQDEGNPARLELMYYGKCLLCDTYFEIGMSQWYHETVPNLKERVDNHYRMEHGI